MPDMSTQDSVEVPLEAGSALFCRLPPTNRITEFLTLAFYPLFFGVVGTFIFIGNIGVFFGVGIGVVLAVVAITFRRRGARWAISHIEKRTQDVIDGGGVEGGEVAPHNNMVLITEVFYLVMEVYIISILSSFVVYKSFIYNIDLFYLKYDNLSNFIDYIFTYYHGLDYEINKHIGSLYEVRVLLIKSSISLIIMACVYGSILVSIRLLFGWDKYVEYLRLASSEIYIKNESKVLYIVSIFFLLLISSFYTLQYGGLEYFLLMDKIPDVSWYLFKSLIVFILASCGFVLFLYFQVMFLSSYLVLLYVHLFSSSSKSKV